MYQGNSLPPPDPALADNPVRLLQELIRFDTSNPPGQELECIQWIEKLLSNAGIETDTFATDPARPNLFAEIPGGDEMPPILLYGHVDVVPVNRELWTRPPFAGIVEDGFIWGRGALDMKCGVAMMLSVAVRVARGELNPAGNLQILFLSDEESGGMAGAGYITKSHQELFERTEYAIGEFGGFSMSIGSERFYPIQVSEKLSCVAELTFTGSGGHASLPHSGNALEDLARAVIAIESYETPIRSSYIGELMVESVAAELDDDLANTVRGVLDPERATASLAALGDNGMLFEPVVRNMINSTLADAGSAVNVIPSQAKLSLDCRIIPGQTEATIRTEIQDAIPNDITYTCETTVYGPSMDKPDLGLFDLLQSVMRDADPDSTAVPFLLFASTDARHLYDVDVQSYGFIPMRLPLEFDFLRHIHAPDERIPVDCVTFGTETLAEIIKRYGPDVIQTYE